MTQVTPSPDAIKVQLEGVSQDEVSTTELAGQPSAVVPLDNAPCETNKDADLPSSAEPCTRSAGHHQQQNVNGFGKNLLAKWLPMLNENGCGNNNNNTKLEGKARRPVELVWKDLIYNVTETKWNNLFNLTNPEAKVFNQKRLLDSISGSFKAGELMAIMGPSGAGKTTLIECISGRRRVGVSGDIFVCGGDKRTRLSYNAQDDSLMPCLTVWETLMFASKLRNYQRNNRLKVKLVDDNDNVYNATTFPEKDLIISLTNKAYHMNLVNSIISKLGLDACKHVRAENCSGGQQKRLSIALELIHSPTILILDEPTSGLDSVSCLQCVRLLRDLAHNTDQPMAIAASIHQPTARILQNFDRLYVIAINGQCMYDGPTDQLVSYLSRFQLTCPTYHNPADFVVEIASMDYGGDGTRQLVEEQKRRHEQAYHLVASNRRPQPPPKYREAIAEVKPIKEADGQSSSRSIEMVTIDVEASKSTKAQEDASLVSGTAESNDDLCQEWETASIHKVCRRSRKQVKSRELYKTFLLWTRCLKLSTRDPTEYLMRTFATIAIIILNLILYYKTNIGKADGCSQDSFLHMLKSVTTDYQENATLSMADSLLEGPGGLAILNFGFVFFAVLFTAFMSMMPVILTFPMEVGVFYKEYFNGWYSFSSYFLAKNLTNLLPTILVPLIFGTAAYMITGQIEETWRFVYFITILVLISLVCDGVGLSISALFVHNVNAASIFAAIAQIPLLLFTGLLVQINTLPRFLQPFTYLSYFRLCFESALITLYGFGRCGARETLSMAQLRTILGDDVEEVIDCVWSHTSVISSPLDNFFGGGGNATSAANPLYERVSKMMATMEKQNPSLIMQNFDLHDEDLHFLMSLLASYAVIARIIAYIILYHKASQQK